MMEVTRTFSGDDEQSIHDWIAWFEDENVDLSDKQRLFFGRRLLRGSAKIVIVFERPVRTWRKFKKVLIEEFDEEVDNEENYGEREKQKKAQRQHENSKKGVKENKSKTSEKDERKSDENEENFKMNDVEEILIKKKLSTNSEEKCDKIQKTIKVTKVILDDFKGAQINNGQISNDGGNERENDVFYSDEMIDNEICAEGDCELKEVLDSEENVDKITEIEGSNIDDEINNDKVDNVKVVIMNERNNAAKHMCKDNEDDLKVEDKLKELKINNDEQKDFTVETVHDSEVQCKLQSDKQNGNVIENQVNDKAEESENTQNNDENKAVSSKVIQVKSMIKSEEIMISNINNKDAMIEDKTGEKIEVDPEKQLIKETMKCKDDIYVKADVKQSLRVRRNISSKISEDLIMPVDDKFPENSNEKKCDVILKNKKNIFRSIDKRSIFKLIIKKSRNSKNDKMIPMVKLKKILRNKPNKLKRDNLCDIIGDKASKRMMN